MMNIMTRLVPLPSAEEREQIIDIYAKKALIFDGDFSIQELVQRRNRDSII